MTWKPATSMPTETITKLPKLYTEQPKPIKDITISLVLRLGVHRWYIAESDGIDVLFGAKATYTRHRDYDWNYFSYRKLFFSSGPDYPLEYDSEHEPCPASLYPEISNRASTDPMMKK